MRARDKDGDKGESNAESTGYPEDLDIHNFTYILEKKRVVHNDCSKM